MEFKTKNLKYETIFVSDASEIITINQEQDTSWGFEILKEGQTIESKIQELQEQGYWKVISESSFTNAIENLKTEDKELKEYIEGRKSVGSVNGLYMAKFIIDSKEINTADYFIKRIIIFEIFIKYMENEHKC